MSSLEVAYNELGADYSDVKKRLMNEALVERFVGKFLEDQTFASLKAALEAKDAEAAFMAAHTFKGVCQNLGLSNLFVPVRDLTEVLRAGSLEGADELFSQLEEQYERTVSVISACL